MESVSIVVAMAAVAVAAVEAEPVVARPQEPAVDLRLEPRAQAEPLRRPVDSRVAAARRAPRPGRRHPRRAIPHPHRSRELCVPHSGPPEA